jgi:hypothetical protein
MTTIAPVLANRFGRASSAPSSRSSTAHKLQRCTQTKRGNARGVLSAHILEAAFDHTWLKLGRTHHRSFYRSIPSLGRLVAGRALCRAALAITNSANASGCTPTVRQSLAHHQTISRSGDVPHSHLSCLSSSVAFAGFEPSEASNGRVPKSCGAFPKKKGEFPNVGC